MKRRSYNEYCGVARALDVVGERWTLLIVRNLLLGPQRYTDLLRGLPGITTNLLAKRLQEMETAGLIEPVRTAPGDSTHSYRLTPLGIELEPVVHALGTWGWRFLGQRTKKDHSSFEWLLIALRRDYAGGANVSAELVADGVPYGLSLQPKSAEVSRGSVRNPDLRIRGTGLQLSRLFLDPGGFQRNVKDVTVEGDRRVLRDVTRSFSFPPRAVQ